MLCDLSHHEDALPSCLLIVFLAFRTGTHSLQEMGPVFVEVSDSTVGQLGGMGFEGLRLRAAGVTGGIPDWHRQWEA